MAGGIKRAKKAEEDAPTGVSSAARLPAKPTRPGQCRAYMRQALTQEFEGIVKGFVEGAKSGSCQHVKLATELLEPRPRVKQEKTGRRTILRWVDEMERGV